MLAIHDRFTHQMRNRLKTTGMELGLVRLLQDAGRNEEARTTLCLLESGFQDVAEESDKPSKKPRRADRLRVVSRSFSIMALDGKLEFVPSSFHRSKANSLATMSLSSLR
jgi:hypothetical protein